MADTDKTNEQRIRELAELRHRILELEASEIERKQSEEEIKKRQKYLEAVLHDAPDAIVTLDASHHVLEWNPGAEKMRQKPIPKRCCQDKIYLPPKLFATERMALL